MKKMLVYLALTVGLAGTLGMVDASAVDVHNFKISNFKVEMDLSRDQEGRSVLKTKETIVAEFPNFDQNHGIERSLVGDYDGHPTSLKIDSITDQNGNHWNYQQNGNILRIGDADRYVHGRQTYVISYTQRDVTKHFSDVSKDEFYWDVIGTEWQVPIDQADIFLKISGDIESAWTKDTRCYYGSSGSSQQCPTSTTENTVISSVDGLRARQGVTLAVGFKSGTFAEYQQSLAEKIIAIAMMVLGITNALGLVLAIIFFGIFFKKRKKLATTPEIARIKNQAVIPQYLPPSGYSVLESAKVYSGSATKALSGHIIDWAVRHFVTLSQVSEAKLLGKANYRLDIARDLPIEGGLSAMASQVFNSSPKIGDSITTKELQGKSSSISSGLRAEDGRIEASELYYVNREASDYASLVSKRSLIAGLLMLSLPMLMLSGIVAAYRSKRDLSEKGEELKKYLDGLKTYISVAEEERLRLLQAPGTAEQVGDVASDKGARVKLYERVLPYAVLFGQEKEWSKQLGDLYTETNQSPDWLDGGTAFNAALLSSAISNFAANVDSASSYSSDSGGSSGGGFSGGGGGGGGGGGW